MIIAEQHYLNIKPKKMQTNCLPRTGPKTAVMTSLYASKEKSDQAMAARKPLLEDVKAKIKSIDTYEGEAYQLR